MSGFHPKDLIREVKKRPGIYNRDELVHPRRDHKHQLWMEVAERLTPTEDWQSYTDVEKEARMDEISTKWKHLKDHFYREIKLQEAGEAHKKRKYIYFDDLEFMRPFVGFKLPPMKRNKSYDEALENTQDDYMSNDADIDMDTFLKCTEQDTEDSEYKIEPTSSRPGTHPKLRRVTKSPPKNQPSRASSSAFGKQSSSVNTVKKPSVLSNPNFKVRDGDISFSLSLVPTLRKLGDGLKLRAKIDILRVLQRCVDGIERKIADAPPNARQDKPTIVIQMAENDDIQVDNIEEYEENISIKHEQNDDPLNSSDGNNKTWWT